MPSWTIHLKIGKELLKKTNYNKDRFLFGSLLPDTDYNWKIGRFAAHYYGNLKFPKCPSENMIDIEAFKRDYSNNLNDDLIKGYYVHLLTDNYYNEYIYYNKWVQKDGQVIGIKTNDGDIIEINNDLKLLGKYKHEDLELYGKRLYLQEDLLLPDDRDAIVSSIKLLKDNFIDEDNVKERITYLNKEYIDKFVDINIEEKDRDYIIFTEEELDELLNNCLKYLCDILKKDGLL